MCIRDSVYTDSDWAGCRRTRKSVSAGVIMYGGCPIKSYSKYQRHMSLSSAEAELYAANLGVQMAMGVKSLLEEMGIVVRHIRLCVDATAAIGIMSRRGLGRLRHLEVNELWLQQHVAEGKVVVSKVGTHANVADVGTKALDQKTFMGLLGLMGFHFPREQEVEEDVNWIWKQMF